MSLPLPPSSSLPLPAATSRGCRPRRPRTSSTSSSEFETAASRPPAEPPQEVPVLEDSGEPAELPTDEVEFDHHHRA